MKPNRYIKAMEIGLAHEKEGISYNDLKAKIEKFQGESFNENSESTFVYWFMENFTYRNGKFDPNDFRKTWLGHLDFLNGDKSKIKHSLAIKGYLVNKYFLDGHSAKQYLDYQELVESRQTAQDAREASKEANQKASKSIRLAIWAIVVSAAVGLFSIIIDVVAFSKSPVPPYDVKVIEDNAHTKELEQLKERLYKAEKVLEAQVSDFDSISN